MKICYFGSYLKYYPRHKIIIKGLKQNGIDIFEVHSNSPILLRYPDMFLKSFNFTNIDLIIVGESSNYVLSLAALIKKIYRIPLIFDTFVSLFDTNIDRNIHQNIISTAFFYNLDRINCILSDIVLQGTEQDINYFSETFRINRNKFRRLFIGAEDNIFFPREMNVENEAFKVLFYGTYIPLHGIEHIIMAAKIIENHRDIQFQIIGKGQSYHEIRKLSLKLGIKNIEFIPEFVNYEQLPNYIANADVCLGIFGASDKAKRVIPTKAYQAIAMRKPLITQDSPAARELFENFDNAILCNPSDPKSLAVSILMLKEDDSLRYKVAQNGYSLFTSCLTPKKIGAEMKKICKELLLLGE